jgi:opacity protein-like surface antigen
MNAASGNLNRCGLSMIGLLLRGSIVLAMLLYGMCASAEDKTPGEEELELFMQLNLWTPDINIKTTPGKEIQIGIDEIIENLDLVYMGTFGAAKGKWTFLTDLIYLNLEHSDNHTLAQNPSASLELKNLEMTAWIVSPMAVYNVLDADRMTLGLLAGARYLHLELETETEQRILLVTTESSNSTSGDAWHGIVGVRGFVYLSGKWYLPYYFDVGTGDTELTWQAFAGIDYRFERVGVSLGYRHLEWKLDESDAGGDFLEKLEVSGPMVGIKYWF